MSSLVTVTVGMSPKPLNDRVKLAALCLEDASQGRGPFLHMLSRTQMTFWRILRSNWYSLVMYTILIMHLALIIWEPARIFPNRQVDFNWMPSLIGNSMVALIYSIDVLVRLFVLGRSHFFRGSCIWLSTLVVVLTIFDICSVVFGLDHPMLGRPFRALPLLLLSPRLSRLSKAIMICVRKVADIFALLFFVVSLYAVIGVNFYGKFYPKLEEGINLPGGFKGGFQNYRSAWVTMFVHLTGDGVLVSAEPAFEESNSSYLFFGSFYVFVAMSLMHTCSAVIYTVYHESLNNQMTDSLYQEWESLLAAFHYMDADANGFISFEEFKAMLKTYRPQMPESGVRLFHQLTCSSKESSSIDMADFLKMSELLRLKVSELGTGVIDADGTVRVRQHADLVPSVLLVPFCAINRVLRLKECSHTLYSIVSSWQFDALMAVLIIAVNTLVFKIPREALYSMIPVLETLQPYLSFILISAFFIEMMVKLAHKEAHAFWSNLWMRVDMYVLLINLIVPFSVVVFASVSSMPPFIFKVSMHCFLLRLLRIFHLRAFTLRLRVIIGAYTRSLRIGLRLIAIILTLTYMYASIGMQLFDPSGEENAKPVESNFDSFGNTMYLLARVVLELDWHEVLFETIVRSNAVAVPAVYFISFFCITIFLFMNLLFELIVELYMNNRARPNSEILVHMEGDRRNQILVLRVHLMKSDKDIVSGDLAHLRASAARKVLSQYESEFNKPEKISPQFDLEEDESSLSQNLTSVYDLVDNFGALPEMQVGDIHSNHSSDIRKKVVNAQLRAAIKKNALVRAFATGDTTQVLNSTVSQQRRRRHQSGVILPDDIGEYALADQ